VNTSAVGLKFELTSREANDLYNDLEIVRREQGDMGHFAILGDMFDKLSAFGYEGSR
jgi:hypothetical protein